MSPYCIKPDCSIAARFPQPAHETDFVGLTRRSPHRITLRVCGCGSLPAHIRILAMLSHRSMLIHVCATYCISPRAASHCVLPRRYRYSHSRDASHRFMLIHVCATYCISPRAASHCVLPRRYRYSHSRDAVASLHAHTCLCHILYKPTRRFALRASASLQVFAFSRCFASLHAHTCYRRKATVGLAHPSGVQSASGMRRTYTVYERLCWIV
jgi:hypothetical protein